MEMCSTSERNQTPQIANYLRFGFLKSGLPFDCGDELDRIGATVIECQASVGKVCSSVDHINRCTSAGCNHESTHAT